MIQIQQCMPRDLECLLHIYMAIGAMRPRTCDECLTHFVLSSDSQTVIHFFHIFPYDDQQQLVDARTFTYIDIFQGGRLILFRSYLLLVYVFNLPIEFFRKKKLRWKGNFYQFQFCCLAVHGNFCWNERLASNFKSCFDVQTLELLVLFSLDIIKLSTCFNIAIQRVSSGLASDITISYPFLDFTRVISAPSLPTTHPLNGP
jgi:hypothetical protein